MQQGNKSQNTAHKYVKLLIKPPQLFSQQVAMGLLNSSTGELLGIPWVHFFFQAKKTPQNMRRVDKICIFTGQNQLLVFFI